MATTASSGCSSRCRPASPAAWEIDTWLMSCRVLRRDVEKFMLDCLIGAARAGPASTPFAVCYPCAHERTCRSRISIRRSALTRSRAVTTRVRYELRVESVASPLSRAIARDEREVVPRPEVAGEKHQHHLVTEGVCRAAQDQGLDPAGDVARCRSNM